MAVLLVESLIHSKGKVQTAVRAMELIFLSAGLISTVVMVKNAVFPCSFAMVFYCIKSLTSSFKFCLSSPLCICLVINFMVVLIAATSAFHRHMDSHGESADENGDDVVLHTALSPPEDQQEHKKVCLQDAIKVKTDAGSAPPAATEPEATRNKFPGSNTFFETHESQQIWKDIEEDKHNRNADDSFLAVLEVVNLAKTREIKWMDSLESAQNPVEITQNTICRIENKNDGEDGTSGEEGKQLQLMEEHQEYSGSDEDDESMEAMWKAIIKGADKRVNNKLQKSETWPVEIRMVSVQKIDSQGLLPSAATAWKELRKSVTFDEAMSMTKRGGLVRDPSMSLDAFNSLVEGFINRFNNALRIERQESEQRFLDMISQGI